MWAHSRDAFKRAGSNYHLSFLPSVMPWLLAFGLRRVATDLAETAIDPSLFSRAVAEHEALMGEADATISCERPGGSKSTAAKRALAPPLNLIAAIRLYRQSLDTAGALAIEAIARRCLHAVFWPGGKHQQSLGVTRAYANASVRSATQPAMHAHCIAWVTAGRDKSRIMDSADRVVAGAPGVRFAQYAQAAPG